MGFVDNDARKGVWMTLNGGALQVTGANPDLTQVETQGLFTAAQINSGGYGITDVCWANDKEVWAVGGSGVIFHSVDGGKSFRFDASAKDIPGNLYRVKFFGEQVGFALGSNGVLLRYKA
jgi:photosystem II stability/assembly factor-like uncharacterized protein